mmetsp:Transcript_17220/g.34514  ORF Transcript_17220/g.34514 Transcript_17220/m.34514 type:complete len:335 (-) Transcript_17220:20-1024(-)
MDDEPIRGLTDDAFFHAMGYLDLVDIYSGMTVARRWKTLLRDDSSDALWTRLVELAWRDKCYVAEGIKVLAGGEEAVSTWKAAQRSELLNLSVKKLKTSLVKRGVASAAIAGCFEKREFVDLLLPYVTKQGENLSVPYNPLDPSSLLASVPTPSSVASCCASALRLSVRDSRRSQISERELCGLAFQIRTRADGPLREVCQLDPWYMGVGAGRVIFRPTDEGAGVDFTWPKGEDGRDLNPFEPMGLGNSPSMTVNWNLVQDQRVVNLLFSGQAGPQEVIARHPGNWGWVLFSRGTCWTSWEYTKEDVDEIGVADEDLRPLYDTSMRNSQSAGDY